MVANLFFDTILFLLTGSFFFLFILYSLILIFVNKYKLETPSNIEVTSEVIKNANILYLLLLFYWLNKFLTYYFFGADDFWLNNSALMQLVSVPTIVIFVFYQFFHKYLKDYLFVKKTLNKDRIEFFLKMKHSEKVGYLINLLYSDNHKYLLIGFTDLEKIYPTDQILTNTNFLQALFLVEAIKSNKVGKFFYKYPLSFQRAIKYFRSNGYELINYKDLVKFTI